MRERRTERSSVPDEALSMFFDYVASRAKCTSIALADHEGLLISGSGEDQDDLAAKGVAGHKDVGTATMEIQGQQFVLVWQGGKPPISQTRQAVERIFLAR